MAELVSIIIPAHNAERFLPATLASAAAQTYRNCEILVVDDGSTDGTAAVVQAAMQDDPRIRLLRQEQGGVARARNHGIAEAAGQYIAPLDADDIWHPEKIARQLAALQSAGPDFALAYNWYRRIDEEGRVLPGSPSPHIEGRVFHRHIAWNFISNGSTPLIRAEVARATLYEPALYDAGCQGVEDYGLQLHIARNHGFLCVPAYLTGYRRVPGAMSTKTARMIESHIVMFGILRREVGRVAARLIDRELARLNVELMRNRLRARAPVSAVASLAHALWADAPTAIATVRAEVEKAKHFKGGAPDVVPGLPFADYGAEAADGSWSTRRSAELLAELKRLDETEEGRVAIAR
jgi:glycosyltransferase involved in cell wall biosynthesis